MYSGLTTQGVTDLVKIGRWCIRRVRRGVGVGARTCQAAGGEGGRRYDCTPALPLSALLALALAAPAPTIRPRRQVPHALEVSTTARKQF